MHQQEKQYSFQNFNNLFQPFAYVVLGGNYPVLLEEYACFSFVTARPKRIISNPNDYILDQNHHDHLANGTKNSDWMYVYELTMNSKIKDWIANK